jgi:hypothetical protein
VTDQKTITMEVRLHWWAMPAARVLYFLCATIAPVGCRVAPRLTRWLFMKSLGFIAKHAGCIRSERCQKGA